MVIYDRYPTTGGVNIEVGPGDGTCSLSINIEGWTVTIQQTIYRVVIAKILTWGVKKGKFKRVRY